MFSWLQPNLNHSIAQLNVSGGETVEGTADGDARTPRQLYDPRVEPLHSDSCCVWRSVYRSSVCPSWLHGGHRLRYGNTAGCHHHLPVLWDIRQGAERDGRHEYTTLLNCVLYDRTSFKILLFICVGLVIKKTLIVTLTKTLRLNRYWFNVCVLYCKKALMKNVSRKRTKCFVFKRTGYFIKYVFAVLLVLFEA